MNKAYIICGAPGAGKTSWARRLSADRHAVLLDIDSVSERLVRLALAESGHSEDDRDSEHFKRTYREPIYEALFDIEFKLADSEPKADKPAAGAGKPKQRKDEPKQPSDQPGQPSGAPDQAPGQPKQKTDAGAKAKP